MKGLAAAVLAVMAVSVGGWFWRSAISLEGPGLRPLGRYAVVPSGVPQELIAGSGPTAQLNLGRNAPVEALRLREEGGRWHVTGSEASGLELLGSRAANRATVVLGREGGWTIAVGARRTTVRLSPIARIEVRTPAERHQRVVYVPLEDGRTVEAVGVQFTVQSVRNGAALILGRPAGGGAGTKQRALELGGARVRLASGLSATWKATDVRAEVISSNAGGSSSTLGLEGASATLPLTGGGVLLAWTFKDRQEWVWEAELADPSATLVVTPERVGAPALGTVAQDRRTGALELINGDQIRLGRPPGAGRPAFRFRVASLTQGNTVVALLATPGASRFFRYPFLLSTSTPEFLSPERVRPLEGEPSPKLTKRLAEEGIKACRVSLVLRPVAGEDAVLPASGLSPLASAQQSSGASALEIDWGNVATVPLPRGVSRQGDLLVCARPEGFELIGIAPDGTPLGTPPVVALVARGGKTLSLPQPKAKTILVPLDSGFLFAGQVFQVVPSSARSAPVLFWLMPFALLAGAVPLIGMSLGLSRQWQSRLEPGRGKPLADALSWLGDLFPFAAFAVVVMSTCGAWFQLRLASSSRLAGSGEFLTGFLASHLAALVIVSWAVAFLLQKPDSGAVEEGGAKAVEKPRRGLVARIIQAARRIPKPERAAMGSLLLGFGVLIWGDALLADAQPPNAWLWPRPETWIRGLSIWFPLYSALLVAIAGLIRIPALPWLAGRLRRTLEWMSHFRWFQASLAALSRLPVWLDGQLAAAERSLLPKDEAPADRAKAKPSMGSRRGSSIFLGMLVSVALPLVALVGMAGLAWAEVAKRGATLTGLASWSLASAGEGDLWPIAAVGMFVLLLVSLAAWAAWASISSARAIANGWGKGVGLGQSVRDRAPRPVAVTAALCWSSLLALLLCLPVGFVALLPRKLIPGEAGPLVGYVVLTLITAWYLGSRYLRTLLIYAEERAGRDSTLWPILLACALGLAAIGIGLTRLLPALLSPDVAGTVLFAWLLAFMILAAYPPLSPGLCLFVRAIPFSGLLLLLGVILGETGVLLVWLPLVASLTAFAALWSVFAGRNLGTGGVVGFALAALLSVTAPVLGIMGVGTLLRTGSIETGGSAGLSRALTRFELVEAPFYFDQGEWVARARRMAGSPAAYRSEASDAVSRTARDSWIANIQSDLALTGLRKHARAMFWLYLPALFSVLFVFVLPLLLVLFTMPRAADPTRPPGVSPLYPLLATIPFVGVLLQTFVHDGPAIFDRFPVTGIPQPWLSTGYLTPTVWTLLLLLVPAILLRGAVEQVARAEERA